MASHILRPDADEKSGWTEVPSGTGYSTIDDPVSYPSTPTTSDRLETNAGAVSTVSFPDLSLDRAVTGATLYTYLKSGTGSVTTTLRVEGGATLATHSTYGSAGLGLGVNEDHNWYYANAGHAAGAPIVKNMGGTHARYPLYWFNHQFSEGGTIYWNDLSDSAYNAILSAGLKPIVVVLGAPDFAGSPSGYPPSGLRIPDTSHIDDFAAFVDALQSHLPQALIQVWNEPNYSLFGNGASATHLAAMTNAASQAIQPNEIIAPAMSPGGEQEASAYFNTMWDNITEDSYVKAAAHIYPGPSGWQTDISNWLTRLEQRSPSRGWITECGFHQQNHGGATNQNTRSKVMYQMASDAGIEGIIYHRFRTSHDTTWETNGDFGIVNNALSGSNFVTNDLYTALADARDDDPNLGLPGTYQWTSDKYTGSLSQTQVNALRADFTGGAPTGGTNSEVAAAYVVVETLTATPGVPAKPVVEVPALPAGAATQSFQRGAVKVEVLQGGAPIAELETVYGGSVDFDSRAASRARLESLTLVDDGTMGLIPTQADSLLAPTSGHELRVSRGVTWGDSVYLAQLGIFVIERTSVSDSGDGYAISVSGQDRSQRYVDAAFEAPYQVAGGTLARDAILTILGDASPDFEYIFVDTSVPLPFLGAEEGEDRWAFCQGIAAAMGCELFFNSDGVLVLQPIPAPNTSPAATYAEGEGGVLLSVNREWDRGEVYNRVIVTGESTQIEGTPPRGVATDNDPTSPTYYGDPFGRKPYFWSNQFIVPTTGDPTGNLAATTAAEGLLARILGMPAAIDFQAIVDPDRRPGQTILIDREPTAPSELHVIDRVSIPLDFESPMSAVTRVAQILISS